jgi:hypothetical protein
MTLDFPNHQITIYRNRRISSSNRFSMSATFTPYSADIQPGSELRQQLVPERWGAVFTAFVDTSSDIQEGDQVHTEDGKLYSVRGVQHWEGGGGFSDIDHLELVLVALDS